MKRWFKYIIYFVITLIILTLTGIGYWERKQTIDFSSMLPKSLKYCGREITSKDEQYMELFTWFKNNRTEWVNTPVSYAPGTIFWSPKIIINVLRRGVVVNYSPSSNEWGQVSKEKKEGELLMTCEQLTNNASGTHNGAPYVKH
jgi:hypothetical protein